MAFPAACAVLALHVLDDGILQPEPGTAAGDHIVSVLVPLALLTAAALRFPRLRAGARGGLAIALGALAAVGAGIALADVADRGATGDDWTGLLLVPAAVALVGLGAAELWCSRRTTGPLGRRLARRAGLLMLGVLGAYIILVPLGVAIFATHRPRGNDVAVELGRPYADVRIPTSDGLRLAGRYIASRNGAAVIVIPGTPSRAPHARMLARHGYGVLMLEPRGYGDSEGDPNAFGWRFGRDVDAATAFLDRRRDVRHGRIGGLGLSVGGEILLEAAARNYGLKAVVADGAGERLVRETLQGGSRMLPAVPSMAVETAAVTVLGDATPPPAIEDVIGRIAPRAVLLVYGEHDQPGARELAPQFFAAARPPKTIWRVPDAGHTGGLSAQPDAYERHVVGFLNRMLLSTPRH
jgi:dienelactone hydrolase